MILPSTPIWNVLGVDTVSRHSLRPSGRLCGPLALPGHAPYVTNHAPTPSMTKHPLVLFCLQALLAAP